MKEKEVMQLAKDYSYGAFNYFHEQLSKEFCNIQPYLKIRRNFWTKVKIGKYNFEEAKPILEEFSSILETEIERIVSRKSFVYWLHVYRRIFPGKINSSTTPLEILNTRRIMEISFQKYGKEALCSHINKLSVVSAKKVFNGLYTNPKFYKEYEGLLNSKDILVLTDFGVKELKEIYDLEKLCLELHYINKTYRILGKGGYLDFHEINNWYNISISNEIEELIKSYDERLSNNRITSSYLGVYYNDNILNNEDASSECFYPIYNVGEITFQDFSSITEELYEMTIDTPLGRDKPNFVLDSINLKKFYKQHKETSSFFYSTNKVKLELLLIIIHDLSIQITSKTHNSFGHFYNLLQRGYVLYDKKKFFNSLKKRISRIEDPVINSV